MKALIDTSSFLWFIGGSEKLSKNARDFMENFDNELFMSVVSLWEIGIKISINKLELAEPFDTFISQKIKENDLTVLPIELPHISQMMKLPFHHPDPFDRLIIAQSIAEQLPIIGCDGFFKSYDIDIIW
ncbi:MAG: type II toxin-antitoxin system VapC family toxin [Desulfamplus sp.]